MEKLFHVAEEYIKGMKWQDMALLKLCLCAAGLSPAGTESCSIFSAGSRKNRVTDKTAMQAYNRACMAVLADNPPLYQSVRLFDGLFHFSDILLHIGDTVLPILFT